MYANYHSSNSTMMFVADKVFPFFFAFLLGWESAVDIMYSSNADANGVRTYNTLPRIINK